MYSRIRAEARHRRRRLLQEINPRIERGEAIDFSDLRQQLDTLQALATLRTPWERALYSLLPVLAAVLILWPLWSIHQSAPSIELSTRVSRVIVYPGTPPIRDLGGLGQVHTLRIEGLDSLDSDIGNIDFENAKGNGSVYLDGSPYVTQMELSPLGQPLTGDNAAPQPVSRIAISKRKQLGELYIENFGINIQANFEKPMQVVSSVRRQVRHASPSDAILDLDGPSVAPTQIRLSFELDKHPIEFPVLRAQRLTLRDMAFNSHGEQQSFSSIKQGTLTIVGTGRQHELLRGTSLSLGKLDGMLRVTLGHDGLDLDFHGTAGVVGIGDDAGNTIRDLRPSLAEWISSDRNVALAWSGLLFIIGLIITVRRSILG